MKCKLSGWRFTNTSIFACLNFAAKIAAREIDGLY